MNLNSIIWMERPHVRTPTGVRRRSQIWGEKASGVRKTPVRSQHRHNGLREPGSCRCYLVARRDTRLSPPPKTLERTCLPGRVWQFWHLSNQSFHLLARRDRKRKTYSVGGGGQSARQTEWVVRWFWRRLDTWTSWVQNVVMNVTALRCEKTLDIKISLEFIAVNFQVVLFKFSF